MATVAFLEKAYLAYFGRPLDVSATIAYGSTDAAVVMTAFSSSAESKALYPTFGLAQINAIYNMLFGRDADLEGAKTYLGHLASGSLTPADVAMAILNGAQNADKTAVDNKLIASAAFTAALDTTAEAMGYAGNTAAASARAFLSTITASAPSAAAVAAAVINAVGTTVVATNVSSALSIGQDNLVGSAAADTFKALVVQNANGSQTNQLATGDQINGGAGVDSLLATVQMASALGNSSTQAITPITTSVEKAMFTALTVNNAAESAVINAKSMTGLTSVGSVQSDVSLVIQNLTTLTDTAVYADRRSTESVTIRMDHSGNGNSVGIASDLNVLFDNDYLVSGKSVTDNAYFFLEDRAGAAANSGKPLTKISNDGIKFTVNGVAKTITLTAAQLAAFQAGDGTWAGYTALLKGALASAAATDNSLAGLQINLSTTVFQSKGLDGTTLPVPAPAITLSSAGASIEALGFSTSPDSVGQYDVFANLANEAPTTIIDLVTSNIELFKVGRGAEGGNLAVGAMASTALTGTYALKQGIERFNITVEGDATQFSSLASLQSTNNTLKEVNVVSKAGSLADLLIGNHNSLTGAYALKDVQTFNATGLNGNLVLNAAITGDAIAKYINTKDGAPAVAAADNVAFAYSGGAGNDTMYVQIDSAAASRRISGLEDFTFKIDGGNGNDKIKVTLDAALAFNSNWYASYSNQDLNHNITVNGGAGNDTISTPGAGDMSINGDAGDDVIFSNNAGSSAQFVFNTADQSASGSYARTIDDLRSGANETYVLPQSKLSVLFKGVVTADIAIPGVGLNKSDLQINQAIKLAINGDAVLSKLIEAVDGPANTLLIKSLIDGTLATTDLQISVKLPAIGTLSALDIANAGTAFQMAAGTANDTTVLAAMAIELARFTTKGDYATAYGTFFVAPAYGAFAGAPASTASDNIIKGGTGNDVMVLGTTLGATVTTSSNETLVFGAGFGADTVVNFTIAGNSMDRLDFTGIGGAALATLGAAPADKSVFLGSALATPALVANEFKADNAVANTYVYVAVSGSVGTVYSVADAAGANNAVATREGSINLAGTGWVGFSALNIANSADVAYNLFGGPNAPAAPATGPAVLVQAVAATNGANAFDAAAGLVTFNVSAASTYTYNIANFGAGDKLVFPAGSAASVRNTDYTDGIVDVGYSVSGQTVTIRLSGISTANDGLLSFAADFATVFGTGTIA